MRRRPKAAAYSPTQTPLLPRRHRRALVTPGGIEALVVTLRRTPDRTARAMAMLSALDCPASIVWATDCCDPRQMAELPVVTAMQPGEIALVDSMHRALRLIVRRGLEWGILFEDDAEQVRPGAIEALSLLPEEADYCVLHDALIPEPEWLPAVAGPFRQCRQPSWQSHAVAVSQKGARAMLAALAMYQYPFDEAIRRNCRHLSGWQCTSGTGFFRQPCDTPSTVRLAEGGRIPRIIHQIWVGGTTMPDQWAACAEQWRNLHPGWEYRLWDDAALAAEFPHERPESWGPTMAAQSDVWRLLVLERFGGLYADTDFEPLRNFERLLAGASLLAGEMHDRRVINALMAAEPQHRLISAMVAEARNGCQAGLPILDAAGPHMVTNVLAPHRTQYQKPVWIDGQQIGVAYGDSGITILSQETLYPYLWYQPRPATYPETAWAAHHWARSWWTPMDWGDS